MDNRTKFGVGFTTIIMMLVIVAFTTLGVLALSTAKNDNELSNKNLDFTSDYYEAEGKAISIRATINKMLAAGASASDIASDLEGVELGNGASASLQQTQADRVSQNFSSGDNMLQYSVAVNDNQVIKVVLDVSSGTALTKEFALKNISEWNPSHPIAVWEG